MSFTFTPCKIEGLYEILPNVYNDRRGNFFESYSERDFYDAGITVRFVQDNQSRSCKGTLRGLHYQKQNPQGKLIRVVEGEVFDVAVDMRCGSPTQGKWNGLILNSEKKNQLYIPPGFAHGILALTSQAILAYKCTNFYHHEDEGGIIWNDPTIGIQWPDIGMEYILSEKDRKLPFWEEINK